MRICSLLPSATEIVCALGAEDQLVGVTHECDFPPSVTSIPKLTRSNIPSNFTSAEIDVAVNASLESSGSLYELDLRALEQSQPDLIITQRLCDVCAVAYDHVQEAAENLSSHPRVLNLEPSSLADILDSIRLVGDAIGRRASADALVLSLQQRIDAVRSKTQIVARPPRVFCMEWVDPPFCGGHWMKELVDLAGGRDDLAADRRPSRRIDWQRVLDFSPEVIVLTCCGFDLHRCAAEADILATFERVDALPAAKSGRIFATDGSAYFSRPGPRIVDSLEILAHLLHPAIFAAPDLPHAFSAVSLSRATAKHA
ncbi:MAG TPA: cobalamin-binding protein [Candidatus Dormibacteraeota bacterium]|nr:cobalamin-binding protein [Candidatus Dormibacteraeota bacterium]